jgi:hypothetical protein
MFEALRDAFREAVVNFRAELRRDDAAEPDVSRDEASQGARALVREMELACVEVKLRLETLSSELDAVSVEAGSEQGLADTCLRRAALAEGVGDHETARIAHQYAERHQFKASLLLEKASVLRREVAERARDVEDGLHQLRQAKAAAARMAASAGRTAARHTMTEADRLFQEFERFETRDDGERPSERPRG